MRWQIILRSIISNWTGYAVMVLVGFFLSPLVVRSLGATGYGIWTLVLSLAGYFGLLDLGIRSSVGRFVARNLTLGDDEAVNRTLSGAFAILAGGGVVAMLGIAILISQFFHLFQVEPQYASAARTALLLAGLNIACVLPLGVFTSLLSAMERFDIVSAVSIAGELTRAALILMVLKYEQGLVALAAVALVTSLGQYLAMAILAKRLHRPLRISFSLVNLDSIRELFSFGIYRFAWIIANQLIFYSDSVVIGAFIGVASITFYAIANSLINYARNIVSLVTDSMYPSATRLDTQNDLSGLRDLLVVGTRVALIIALPLCIGLIFLGKQFIAVWMGPEYAATASGILTILTLAQFSSMSQYVSALVLAGMAKHRALALFSLVEGVVNLVLSIVLAKYFGLAGVAWGTVIPHVICTAIVIPAYTLRIVGMSPREYFVRGFARPLICAVPAAVLGMVFSNAVTRPTWGLFAAEAAALSLLFAVLSYFICLDRKQRDALKERVWSMLQREPVVHEA